MFPAATLFLDVGVQRDLWPGGAWPVVAAGEADAIATLFAVARELGIRQGGIVCAHVTGEDLGGRPAHAARATAGAGHPDDCLPVRPIRLWEPDAPAVPPADRDHADYVTSGCHAPVEATPAHGRVLDHLAAGVHDAVVFGAVVEDAMAHAVDALLARRVRVHVALDAAATADPERAQRVVAAWKRRFVDGTTVAEIARVLRRATVSN